MLQYEFDGIKRLDIPIKRWGSSFRIRVRNQYGRIIFISNVSKPKNRKLLSNYYKISEERINKHLSKDYHKARSYNSYIGRASETHEYTGFSSDEVYDKVEKLLKSKTHAFKVNIQLGYTLIDRVNGHERHYWPSTNSAIWDDPIQINSKRDVDAKVMSYMKAHDFTERIKYPSSGYQLKEITSATVRIYYRNHRLGNNIEIPDYIKNNRFIIDFPNTNNKCMFFCIAYHLSDKAKKDRRKMTTDAKLRFKQFCEYENIPYSLDVFKNAQPIDIMQFEKLEDCFKVRINVYIMDEDTLEVHNRVESEKNYDNVINILDYKTHAMYITNINNVMNKYPCNGCEAIFETCDKLRNHKKNKCNFEVIESFESKPTMYRPYQNQMKSLLSKYGVKDVDHYLDEFIVYDFEAILEKIEGNHDENDTKLVYNNRHKPVSVSICDSVTGNTKCIVKDTPKALLEAMFEYVDSVSDIIREYNKKKFQPLLDIIEDRVEKLLKAEGDELGITSLKNIRKMRKQNPQLKTFFSKNSHLSSDIEKIEDMINKIPLIGFNSGNYDINIIKNDLFSVLGTDNIDLVIKNPSYMCISTDKIKMLDILNYLPQGTSYDSYLKTYLGGCKCSNKITCLCGLGKGVFCYEYIDSFEKLGETNLPPKEAFYSNLKETHISDDDYERLKFVWSHYEMKTLQDLLIWYNNLDVAPFVLAIQKQREFYKRFGLDMFQDGVSLPGLAEKVMYQICYSKLDEVVKPNGVPFEFPKERLDGYREQDKKADREFNLTLRHLNWKLHKADYLCTHCYCVLNAENVSADRFNNSKGHIDGNIMISCIKCNVARKNMNVKAFRYKKKIEANGDKLIWSIDQEEKDIYHKMKANIAGGPSIIFNRYAKRDETDIRQTGGKKCKKIIGYDANALYLWCLGNEMPCGRLTTMETYDGIIDDIKSDKLFGFLECDISTPEHLKDYFSEMTPIFKNIEIDTSNEDIIGRHMMDFGEKEEIKPTKSKKLIGSYFGEKILIYTPLLKWYLSHGLVINKTYCFIKASSSRPFKGFMEQVSDARRDGDADKSKEMIADMMKLIGNSAFGRSGMDKTKHKQVKYENGTKSVRSIVEKREFHDVEELDGSFEVTLKKRRIKFNNPIHVSIAIYQLAKLRMLQFYYDCIDFYFDRSDFEYQEMDTDSAYIAFSDDHPFKNLIKPELKEHFKTHKYDWFPRDYNKELAAYDRRTAGLFKEEFRCNAMVSLSSKNYICYNSGQFDKVTGEEKIKLSSKGVQKSRKSNIDSILNPDGFEKVIKDQVRLSATNKGFRIDKESKTLVMYTQKKIGLNYWYDKRKVLEDGIRTVPLCI